MKFDVFANERTSKDVSDLWISTNLASLRDEDDREYGQRLINGVQTKVLFQVSHQKDGIEITLRTTQIINHRGKEIVETVELKKL